MLLLELIWRIPTAMLASIAVFVRNAAKRAAGNEFFRQTPTLKTQVYSYMPLQHPDSIRVLTLYPGDAPHFEALSYTWATDDGDATRSQNIDCNGTTIKITKSCEAALRRLREESSDRTLWVDAICINQEDIKERGLQVGMMGDVYSKAARVLVWLGPASDDKDPETSQPVSDLYMDYLHGMAHDIERLSGTRQSTRDSPSYRHFISDIYMSVADGKHSSLSKGYDSVQNRSWWKRIWVLQEVIVAKSVTVICGEKSIRYSDFRVMYDALRKGSDTSHEANVTWSALGISRKHLSLYPESTSKHSPQVILHRILRRGQDLQATDARDHIFGILGLSEDLRSILPKADYTQSLVNVFTEVTKGILTSSKSLHAISVVTPGEPTDGFPSWVTVWSNPMTHNFQDWNDTSYHAAKDSKAIYVISDDNRELKVLGKIIDTVAIGPLLDPSTYYLHGTEEETIPGWQESCRHGFSLDSYPTGESVHEVVWRSLCWNKADGYYPARAGKQKEFDDWYRVISAGKPLAETVKLVWALGNGFWRALNTASPLCTTANGYSASAPYTTISGDCIAVLSGGGPCYVHGIMKGEAFPEDPSELQWVSIR